jgi:hypothetical protein
MKQPSLESSTRRCFWGRLRQAVRQVLHEDEDGGVLPLDEIDPKSGKVVLEVLKDKHPKMRDPDLGIEDGAFEEYEELPEPIPLCISVETVEKVASKLSGAAGTSGTDAIDARNLLLRFGSASEKLRRELAKWAEWLSNGHPPWAAYRALMACRLVALDKCPGV